MTFSWAKVLLILIAVGLSTSFLAINHVVISAQLNSSVTPICTSTPANINVIDNCDLTYHQLNQSEGNYPGAIDLAISSDNASNNILIINDTSLLDAIGIVSVNTKSTPLPSSNDIHYVPTYSARYINLAQHHLDEIKPSYLLAYEFTSPPIPSLVIGYQVDFSPQLDWTLSTVSSPSRLSGWKESNLLFVHTHIC
ncbi:hypothetical protein [Shewanella sp. OMA3-2]|uniref:hypothetical protein n=1 Tax=Shewanella sp. OMA3-2 TaxID=2908650 RepID=UPI001F2710A9|nr:hypothetical protein [Shewanella sp. OMA3-2]UJF23023.1 hypothetical protein L0B17_06600 [Shewanella sp. OMA3-2]